MDRLVLRSLVNASLEFAANMQVARRLKPKFLGSYAIGIETGRLKVLFLRPNCRGERAKLIFFSSPKC